MTVNELIAALTKARDSKDCGEAVVEMLLETEGRPAKGTVDQIEITTIFDSDAEEVPSDAIILAGTAET